MPRQFQEKLLNFMESGHIKVDQMRKQYDFKIKGAKVFGACNEISRLSKPLQSRFRRLYLPPYTEEQFLKVAAKVLPKLKIAHVIGKAVWEQRGDIRDVISIGKYDTAIVVRPANAMNIFDLRVKEILCKPLTGD